MFYSNRLFLLPLQIENLEELLKEKDNQVDIARSKLSAVQAQTFSSEGTVTSLEEALADRDKQINQLRDQRDRAEKDLKDEKVMRENNLQLCIKTVNNMHFKLLYSINFYILFFSQGVA